MAGDTSGRVEFARTLAGIETLSVHALIVDRLCDALFDIDDVLGMLTAADAAGVRWIEPAVRKIYEDIDDVLTQLCD
jgi:hypothetical protein